MNKILNGIKQFLFWYPKYQKAKKENDINKNVIFSEGCVFYKKDTFIVHNWGDDLNKYLFELITGKKMFFIPHNFIFRRLNIERYLLIGSILNFYDLNNTIIYGSGIIDPKLPIIGKPKEIISVRGPRTQKILQEHGIDCPSIYGDPALLLPLFVKPKHLEKKQICIIPHKDSKNLDVINMLTKKYSFYEINMSRYDDWHDVIDKITNSELVISESLHGLIVAEAYGIPSVWVEFKEHQNFWNFKFEDFYESIGKKNMDSLKLYQSQEIDNFDIEKISWDKADILYDDMLKKLPFKIIN